MFQSSPGTLTGCNLGVTPRTVQRWQVSILTRHADRVQLLTIDALRERVKVSILTRHADRVQPRRRWWLTSWTCFNPHPAR